jgi:Cu+-exporting ATPase
MTCAIGCAATIEKKLNKTPGIQSAKVDFENAIAQIVFDPNWIKDQELTNVIQEVGSAYKVTDNKSVDSFSVLK